MSVGADFVASKVIGSNQLNALSRHANHGLFHESTCGQVTTSAGMTLAVGAIPAGAAIVNGTVLAAVSGSTVNITASHATLDRRDVVWVDTTGTFGVTDGTAAAIPAPPALTDGRLALAEIAVAATVTSITSGNITDKRQRLSCPRLVYKTATETVNNSAVLQSDDHLFFSVFPNEVWQVELNIAVLAGPAAAGFKQTWDFPANTTGSHSLMVGTPTGVQFGGYGATLGATYSFGSFSSAITSGVIFGKAIIIVGNTAGTCTFQWAQGTATASNTTLQGSSLRETYMIARRLL